MHVSHRFLGAAAAAALLAHTAGAQASSSASSRPTIGIFGGAAFPTGDFGKGLKSGYEVGAHLGFRPAASSVGFRIEGMYNRFDPKGLNPGNFHTNVLSGNADAVVMSAGAPGSIRPYFLGGIGVYNIKTGDASETRFGLNGGAGLDMPLSGIDVYLEARYHYVFTNSGNNAAGFNAAYVPVVVGVRF